MTSSLKRLFVKTLNDKIGQNVYTADLYDKSHALPIKLLRWSSVPLKQNKTISIYWRLYHWFKIINFAFFVLSEFLGFLIILRGAQTLEDYNKAVNVVPFITFTIPSLFKALTIAYHRRVYENLMDELRRMWPRGSICESEHDIISRSLKQLNFLVRGYYWANNFQMVCFLAPPFILTLARYMGHDSPKILPFSYWLPFDQMQPVYYEIILILQIWHAIITVWGYVAWDVLFCTLICHITTQFDLLALRIDRLFMTEDYQLTGSYAASKEDCMDTEETEDLSNLHNEQVWEMKQQKELADIVLRHCALIRLSNDLESVCSLTLLVNFISASILICFCGFCSLLVEAWSDFAYKSFLMTALCQTWLLCWYGQKLINSSLAISDALYNCTWYDTSKKFKNNVLIMLHRAQQSVHVTTYGFSVVSLASFTTIVKTSWSYFSLMLNFYKK